MNPSCDVEEHDKGMARYLPCSTSKELSCGSHINTLVSKTIVSGRSWEGEWGLVRILLFLLGIW